MRRIGMALAVTVACIALLIGLKAHLAGPARSALSGTSPTGNGTGPTTGSSAGTGTGPKPSTAGRPAAPAPSGRFTGAPEQTPYGTVQVQAVLSSGRLTDVAVIQRTSGGRSDAIDAYALPILKSEVLKKQSADVDVVSGATYTSSGYATSLQAALDRAGR